MPAPHRKNIVTIPTAHTGSGFVRIIAGKWRGRKLPVKDLQGLRPTTDRVKETVFNWLQTDLYQACCLDLFAGSGSLGFEALSRQAEHVTFVEKNAQANRQLAINMKSLQIDNASLHHTDALKFLTSKQSNKNSYDLVFIDPPFHQNLLEESCDTLESSGMITTDSLIYIETELSSVNLPVTWTLVKEKKAGQVYFRLYRKEK